MGVFDGGIIDSIIFAAFSEDDASPLPGVGSEFFFEAVALDDDGLCEGSHTIDGCVREEVDETVVVEGFGGVLCSCETAMDVDLGAGGDVEGGTVNE